MSFLILLYQYEQEMILHKNNVNTLLALKGTIMTEKQEEREA